MHQVYFHAELSATQRGWVGEVIDAESHRALQRTQLVYAAAEWAKEAARRLWEGRAGKIATASGMREVAA